MCIVATFITAGLVSVFLK